MPTPAASASKVRPSAPAMLRPFVLSAAVTVTSCPSVPVARLVDLRALADRRLGREREDVDDHGAGAGEVARATGPGECDRAELDVGERVQELERRDVDADPLEQAARNAPAPDLLVHDQLDDLDGQAFEDRRVQDPEVDRAVQRLDRVHPLAERHVVRDRRDRGLEVRPLDEAELLEQEPLHGRERHQAGVVEDVALLQDSRELGRPLAVDHLGGEPVDRDLPVREARLVAAEHARRRDDRHGAVALLTVDVLAPDVGCARDVSHEVRERQQLLPGGLAVLERARAGVLLDVERRLDLVAVDDDGRAGQLVDERVRRASHGPGRGGHLDGVVRALVELLEREVHVEAGVQVEQQRVSAPAPSVTVLTVSSPLPWSRNAYVARSPRAVGM